jgi:hypothetical protein
VKRPIRSILPWLRHQAGPLLLLLMLLQTAMVAHRIEHYVAPDLVEDVTGCAAFAPLPDTGFEPPLIVRQPVQFAEATAWTPARSLPAGAITQHAYRSQAPPA